MSSTNKSYTEYKVNGNLLPFKGTNNSLTNENTSVPLKSLKGSKHDAHKSEIETENFVKARSKKRVAEAVHITKSKVTKYDPSELMNKLEEFSNVWNDYPTVSDENNISYHQSNGIVDYPKANSRDKNYNNYMKDKNYSQIVFERNKASLNSVDFVDGKVEDWPSKRSSEDSQEFSGQEIKTSSVPQDELKPTGKYDSKVADLKRKQAVQEHRKLLAEKKNIIKQALSIDGNNKINRKVIFSDLEGNQPIQSNFGINENKKKECFKLFEDSDSDIETDFKLNDQLKGKKSQKLLELQSRYASDSRFNLDKRFYESGSEESEHEITEELDQDVEKRKQLEILESIVNKQIKPLSEIKKSRRNVEETFMVRFDPTRQDHEKYIVKSQESPTNEEIITKKKRKDNQVSTSKNSPSKPEVSSEKFFTVKEDLKKTLQSESGAGFSLLKIFGTKEASHESEEPYNKLEENLHAKRLKYKTKNPFKYDSSESETEQEETQKIKEENPKTIFWKTTFFFTNNDTRLQEAFEFLKVPEESGNIKEYAEKRKMLKNFIRNKFKNNYRKKIHFKKKLGGFKRTINKNKRIQS